MSSSCSAFGAYPNTRRSQRGEDIPCVFPFRYKGKIYRSCVEFSEEVPFIGGSDFVDINYGRKWCSLVPVLAETGWKRKMWG